MRAIPDIKALVDFMRDEGIVELEQDGIRLKLSPSKPPQKELAQEMEENKQKELAPERDPLFGLTAQERLDLFNES